MKTSIKTLAAALVIVGMAGSASAMTVQQDVLSGVSSVAGASSNVSVSFDDGVATLSGYVEDSYAQNAIIQAAKNAGAERVINLTTRSN